MELETCASICISIVIVLVGVSRVECAYRVIETYIIVYHRAYQTGPHRNMENKFRNQKFVFIVVAVAVVVA